MPCPHVGTWLRRGLAGYAATRKQITEAVTRDFANAADYVTIFEDLRKIHTAGLSWDITAWSSEERYGLHHQMQLCVHGARRAGRSRTSGARLSHPALPGSHA